VKGVLTMDNPIDATGTQALLDWSQINWRKVEKTVLRLQHRIFMAKVNWFEKNVLEPLINSMLEEARRRLGSVEQIKVEDDMGAVSFIEINPEDLNGNGRLYPVGSRHFAEQARFVQDLTTTLRNVSALPTVAVHFSGKAVANALSEVMGWDAWGIVKDNAAVIEQAETQRLVQAAQEKLGGEAAQPTELQPHDFTQPPEANGPASGADQAQA